MGETINRRESAALINSLTAGVVPRIGLRHIAVGRQGEIEAFLQDLETIENGGAAFRCVCGKYGSGKSFLLQTIRNNSMERSFVVMDADLSPERRLTGSTGQGLATYRELLQNLSIRTRPEGGALESILQKWIASLQSTIAKECGLQANDPALINEVSDKIAEILSDISELSYGFAFANVLDTYWRGIKLANENMKVSALRWLRGEYATKTEAKSELPVDCIIDDKNWYEFLKLFARFVNKAGYKGLLVCIDEGVNLYKINNKQARERNYEKLLTIFNDTMQGRAEYIGVFMSGTPQFVFDERRGLFSYDALRSRLIDNRFTAKGYVDFSSPVITLKQLSDEEIYLLLERLCEVHSSHYSYETTLGEAELTAFLNMVLGRLGADQLLTPREVTRDFLGLLNILHQNPDVTFEQLINEQGFTVKSADSNPEEINDEDVDDTDADTTEGADVTENEDTTESTGATENVDDSNNVENNDKAQINGAVVVNNDAEVVYDVVIDDDVVVTDDTEITNKAEIIEGAEVVEVADDSTDKATTTTTPKIGQSAGATDVVKDVDDIFTEFDI